MAGPDAAGSKKKSRLNPARRRAAKAKEDVQTSPDLAKPPTKSQDPTLPTLPRKKSAHFTPSASPKQKSDSPLTLSRQNTEPAAKVRKPDLARAVTAPVIPSSKSTALALTAPAIVTGGLVGCAAGAAILFGVGMWYDFSGAEQAIYAARTAKLCVDNLTEELVASLKAGTYSADEALDVLRRTTLAYASTIPDGPPFVERVFREIDMVRKQRGREVDKVVAETYAELSKAGRLGASPGEMRAIVLRQLMKLSNFASNATQDIVTRNPRLRPYRDGVASSLQGPPQSKVPTVRLNMAVRQKTPSVG